MAFPRYPRITPHKISAEKLVETGDSGKAFWISNTPPTWDGSDELDFTAAGQRLCSPLSRYFSPFCTDVEIDATFSHPAPASSTSRLRFGVASSSATGQVLNTANSCIFVESTRTSTTHTIRLIAKQAQAGGDPNGVGTVLVSQVCAFTVSRIRVELRKHSWSVGTTGSEYRLRIYDDLAAVQHTLTGSHGLDWTLWQKPDTSDKIDVGNGWAALVCELIGAANTAHVSTYAVRDVTQGLTHDTVFGPVLDGFSLELPDFTSAEQPNMRFSKLDPTATYFGANGSGGGTAGANHNALENCIAFASEYSMDCWLPPDSEIVHNGIVDGWQWIYQRTNSAAANRRSFSDEARPPSIEGSNQGTGGAKSILRLADGTHTDGTNIGTTSPALRFRSVGYEVDPPVLSHSPNSFYNGQLKNFHYNFGTNAGCRGIEMQGAQGTQVFRMELSATQAFCLFYNLNGSGGGHHTFDLDGGGGTKYLFFLDSSQPGPVVSGVYGQGFTISAVRVAATGNRQCLLAVGWGLDAPANCTVFDISGPADTDDTTFNTQRGQFELIDAYCDFASSHANNTLVNSNRSLVIENVWVTNCTKLVEHPSGDIASPHATNEVYIKRIVIPYDPPTRDTSGLTSPDPYPYQADNYIDGVASTANIVEVYTAGDPEFVARPSDIVDRHRISDAEWITFEDADIDYEVDHSETPDGLGSNQAGLEAGMAAQTAGQVGAIARGYWTLEDTLDVLDRRHLVGPNKQSLAWITVKQPAAGQPFGSGAANVPLLRTAISANTTILAQMNFWKQFSSPTGFAVQIRGGHLTYGIWNIRNSVYGYGGYTGSGGTHDQNASFFQWTNLADGRNFDIHQGTTGNSIDPYSHFKLDGVTGHVRFYHLNGEHVHNWPGACYINNCARVTVYGYKGESNWPSFYVKDTDNFILHGHTGNGTAYIPDGLLPSGETEDVPNDATGYNPEPVEFPEWATPGLIILENVTNFRISQCQDEGRQNNGHPVFGIGTRADFWHFGAEYDDDQNETLLLPIGVRPTLWTKGDVYAGSSTVVVIDNADDESFKNGESIVVTGSGFGAAQGSGSVVISPSDDINDAGAITQTVTSWADGSITITTVRSALAYNTPLYLFVENDDGTSNAAGYAVQFEPAVSVTNTLYDVDGTPVASESAIKASVWRNREPTGAPDQELTGLSTNGSGVITFGISGEGLDPGDPIYLLLHKDHATTWQVGIVKIVPSYS